MNQDELNGIHLYQKIAGEIRKNILNGNYRPGDRLPSMRELKQLWSCTLGTIQRAYDELAQQGLITSLPGRGTHVVDPLDNGKLQLSLPLRKAKLVHKAESFFLESLIAGYSFEEIEESMVLARRHLQTF